MTLEEINVLIAARCGSEGFGLSLGDASLAPAFNAPPERFYWGQEHECTINALHDLESIGLRFIGSRKTDVDRVLVWRGEDGTVVVLEPEGA